VSPPLNITFTFLTFQVLMYAYVIFLPNFFYAFFLISLPPIPVQNLQ